MWAGMIVACIGVAMVTRAAGARREPPAIEELS